MRSVFLSLNLDCRTGIDRAETSILFESGNGSVDLAYGLVEILTGRAVGCTGSTATLSDESARLSAAQRRDRGRLTGSAWGSETMTMYSRIRLAQYAHNPRAVWQLGLRIRLRGETSCHDWDQLRADDSQLTSQRPLDVHMVARRLFE